ncbi:hypothetical protein MLD38_024697 [Melastoma candidum]|uniref:Uncharacterized protein n=1 Tax=Melastoma candidum TaxID=119954 RepID=A0ACB9NU28_9MYRT|nr:hypothetical protein MLD38_024697 [Melastoma candidum]
MIDDFSFPSLDLSLLCYGGYASSRRPDGCGRGHEMADGVSRPDEDDPRLPRLTLGLPDSVPRADSGGFSDGSPRWSASPSFSDSLVREHKGEEGEGADGGSPRKKLKLSKQQTSVLEEHFDSNATLNGRQKQELAEKLNLRPRQVEVWFQNRRARTKLKQTEVDCQMLRKCCETLKEDNARLKMELWRLKYDTEEPSTSPVSICPSCKTSFPSPLSPTNRQGP